MKRPTPRFPSSLKLDAQQRQYDAFRRDGMRAVEAWRAAKIVDAFAQQDRYEIRATEEQENYFDVYGVPDDAREAAQLQQTLERHGCYYVFAFDTVTGRTIDGVGMCMGYASPTDPRCNWYVVDLMQAALGDMGNICRACGGTGRITDDIPCGDSAAAHH